MKRLIACATKQEKCDLVLRNVRLLNLFTGETEEGDLAIADGKIVGLGKGYPAKEEYDARGAYALPGLIDSHIHVESTMLSPEEFARLACAHGTTGIVADPHELTNVCGIAGAEYLAEAFSRIRKGEISPLDVWMQLPSCVPATPFETSGAAIDGKETARELERGCFHGLGEMMNYPAVIAGEEDCLTKLESAKRLGKVTDGHAPGVTGDALNAYACGGIATDHECLNAEECREKLSRGLYVMLRNGSSAHNVEENAKVIDAYNYRRFLLCSDDKNAHDLAACGHIDDALRKLVACGVPAAQAVATATLNPAECYGLKGKGALAPSYDADIVLVDDLTSFRVRAVFKAGVEIARDGKALFSCEEKYLPAAVRDTVRIKPCRAEDFRLRLKGDKAHAMRMIPHNLVTKDEIVCVKRTADDVAIKGTDLLKLAVVERHFASGNIGLGLVAGYGLRGGAIGISVAHDSHNLVILGDDNADMARVAALLERAGGGMALVCGEEEKVFPLDIAGLMSSAPASEVVEKTAQISRRAKEMGVRDGYEPFMSLAFLALPVIPELKLTDRGLFDVVRFRLTEIDA